MDKLIELSKRSFMQNKHLPFSIYTSLKEQKIQNLPILKPLLIFVLSGSKQLGGDESQTFQEGSFVFLSNTPSIDMRNIPSHEQYFALLIDFEYEDFDVVNNGVVTDFNTDIVKGPINSLLRKWLEQFLELSYLAPIEATLLRKKELLTLLYFIGYTEISSFAHPPSLSHLVNDVIQSNLQYHWNLSSLSTTLHMSESTIRRKLKSEGTNIKQVRRKAQLTYGLHLIQTTDLNIGVISENSGYDSQSRFTDQFKELFGITPSGLRKTRMDALV